ncbi:MAG: hypothetical protein ACI4NA_07870 [Succinivibrio sp.]
MWSSLDGARSECPALYRKALNYLKSALEGSCSKKGIESRLGEIDEMIGMTLSQEGREASLGDGIALCALEILRTGLACLLPDEEVDDPALAARKLDLSILSAVLQARELGDEQSREALEGEGALLDAVLEEAQGIAVPQQGRGAMRKALAAALEGGASAAGIEASQPAFA